MEINPLTGRDLSRIAHLQPDGWMPIGPPFLFYTENKFCFPLKVEIGDTIVGIGAAIIHRKTSWLGHIIVDASYRNQGIGTAITKKLMDLVLGKGYKTILLIATVLGAPVYKKLGFEKEGEYIFLRDGRVPDYHSHVAIPFDQRYQRTIIEMDNLISGETRTNLFEPHYNKAMLIVENNELKAFYMPTLGEGLIEASTTNAGLELMRIKYSKDITYAAIPEQNKAGLSFLSANGFKDYRRGIRMCYGKNIAWQPENIYGRIGGNLG